MAATFLHFVQACALALLGLAASGGTSHANPSTEIGDILAGIIHYTRWPHPQPSVRVCLNAQDPDAALIADYFERSYRALPPVVVRQYRLSVESLTDILDCQVVYFGRTSPVDANPLLIQLAKFPILTIGHSEDFCSYAGLFCLIPGNGGFRIAANLDSISRNGLRVNPLLLKLTSRERKAGP